MQKDFDYIQGRYEECYQIYYEIFWYKKEYS